MERLVCKCNGLFFPLWSQLVAGTIFMFVLIDLSGHFQGQLLYPIPTWLVKKFVDQLGPTITAMIGLSFMQGYFPALLKHAIVRQRLKKPSLDPLDIKSYRPISNISFNIKAEWTSGRREI